MGVQSYIKQLSESENRFVPWHRPRGSAIARCGRRIGYAVVLLLAVEASQAQDTTFTVKLLTPETALKAATAALRACHDEGFQAAVAVADRSGVTQVLLRGTADCRRASVAEGCCYRRRCPDRGIGFASRRNRGFRRARWRSR
jgi:hypothetical protein